MENKTNSKTWKKFDLLSLHTDLGGVELNPCPVEQTLEMEALQSDPFFENVTFYQLGGAPGAGCFIDIEVNGRVVTIHETSVPELYRVQDFVIKRNYYCSNQPRPEPPAETLAVESQSRQPTTLTSQKVGSSLKEEGDGLMLRSNVTWGDIMAREEEEYEDSDDPDQVSPKRPSLQVWKQKPKFLTQEFLDKMPVTGQNHVFYQSFEKENKGFSKRDFYLFDYVACFVDLSHVFEIQSDFKILRIEEKLGKLDQISRGDMAYMPLQVVQGWDPMIKSLCQCLNGEYQISFLKTVLFFIVRKVTTSEKIRESKLNPKTKSFLIGDESIFDDCCRVIRLNKVGLLNNQKLLIDVNYAKNCITPVDNAGYNQL